jgi:PAS domain S-box-containing protein
MALPGLIKNPPRWLYIGIFSVLTAAIIIAGILFVKYRSSDIKEEKFVNLETIAKLKTDQIINWRTERFNDAYLIAKDPFIIASLKSRSAADFSLLKKRIITFKKVKEYACITIFDLNGNAVAGDSISPSIDKPEINKIISEDKIVLSDINFNGKNRVFLELFAPISVSNTAKASYLLVIRINPETSLYPIIREWPVPSSTSETLIFSVKNDSVVYLNKFTSIRHSAPLKLSLKNKELPAVMAAHGKRGIVEGIDYRGVKVLAKLSGFPDSNWLMVNKIDIDEIYSSMYSLYFWVVLFIYILIFLSAVIIALIWRTRSTKYYQTLYSMETRQKELLQKYEFITQNANIIIMLLGQDGKILYTNESASRLYGYSPEELLQMYVSQLRVTEQSPDLNMTFERIRHEDGIVYESVHRKKSGELIYIEVSARLMNYDGQDVMICFFRNITENKVAEDLLKKTLREKETLLKEVHHRVKNNLQTISSLLGLQSAMIEDDNVRRIFSDSQTRIKAMSLLHQALYNDTADSVNSKRYFENLIDTLKSSYYSGDKEITLNADIAEIKLSVDTATTLGLIITEIISNIFKHAFSQNLNGEINFSFVDKPDSGFILTISDNGTGLPENFDIEKNSGLGMRLIHLLPKQIGADIQMLNSNGTTYIIEGAG